MKYSEPGLTLDLVKDSQTGEYISFEWRDVVRYEGYYQVSNYGNIKSLDRFVNYRNRGSRVHKGKVMTPRKNNCGYLQISLRKEGYNKRYSIHRLVAQAFISNPENKPCVNHIVPVKTNNLAVNLEWMTHKENTQHAINIGTFDSRGEAGNNTKLTNIKVMSIVNLIDDKKLTFDAIAKKFNTTKSTIGKINTGDSWNHLTNRKGVVLPSNLKGINHPRAKSVKNCRGEEFPLASEASKSYGISLSGISQCCNGHQEFAGKYEDGTKIVWRFKDEL